MSNNSLPSGQDPAPDNITQQEETVSPEPLPTESLAAETTQTETASATPSNSAQSEARPAAPQETPKPKKRYDRPRTSPIVWGALILGFCGYVVQRTLAPGEIDATVWVTAMTIGLGVLLLAVGGAVLIRNRRQ